MKTFNIEHLFPLSNEVSKLIDNPKLFSILHPSFLLCLSDLLEKLAPSYVKEDWQIGVLENGGVMLLPFQEKQSIVVSSAFGKVYTDVLSATLALNIMAWDHLSWNHADYALHCESIKLECYISYCESMHAKLKRFAFEGDLTEKQIDHILTILISTNK